MAGYVDPFAHRLRREGGREPSDGTDELDLDLDSVVDLTDGTTEETEAVRPAGSGRSTL